MPLILASHDSLPYIEPAPTAREASTVAALISAELSSSAVDVSVPHASLPDLVPSKFTPLYEAELARVAANEPLRGIDLSRYEAPAAPESEEEEGWEKALRAAYVSGSYLGARQTNLALLSEFGKNAWLVHNAQLEDVLKRLEEELMAAKTECEVVNKARKAAQVGVRDEMRALEERWRRGVGRVLEVELAAESVRREVLRQRDGGRR